MEKLVKLLPLDHPMREKVRTLDELSKIDAVLRNPDGTVVRDKDGNPVPDLGKREEMTRLIESLTSRV